MHCPVTVSPSEHCTFRNSHIFGSTEKFDHDFKFELVCFLLHSPHQLTPPNCCNFLFSLIQQKLLTSFFYFSMLEYTCSLTFAVVSVFPAILWCAALYLQCNNAVFYATLWLLLQYSRLTFIRAHCNIKQQAVCQYLFVQEFENVLISWWNSAVWSLHYDFKNRFSF